jgi:hypothetical protein
MGPLVGQLLGFAAQCAQDRVLRGFLSFFSCKWFGCFPFPSRHEPWWTGVPRIARAEDRKRLSRLLIYEITLVTKGIAVGRLLRR